MDRHGCCELSITDVIDNPYTSADQFKPAEIVPLRGPKKLKFKRRCLEFKIKLLLLELVLELTHTHQTTTTIYINARLMLVRGCVVVVVPSCGGCSCVVVGACWCLWLRWWL